MMFCPLYDVGGKDLVGVGGTVRASLPNNYNKLVNTARDLKNITSRLIETGLLAQYSVTVEQLYRLRDGNAGSWWHPK